MNDGQRLIEKLWHIEALFARRGTEGERVAAERAREHILAKLRDAERIDPPREDRFAINDPWSRRLFVGSTASRLRASGDQPQREHGATNDVPITCSFRAVEDDPVRSACEPRAGHDYSRSGEASARGRSSMLS